MRAEKNFLTHYPSPTRASREERAVARLALLLLRAMIGGVKAIDPDPVIDAAGRLLYWSPTVLFSILEQGEVKASQLVSPDEWDNIDWRVINPVLRNRSLMRRLVRDSLRWIDSAADGPANLDRNIGFLAEAMSFTEAERALVRLIAISRCTDSLTIMLRQIPASNLATAARFLAKALDVPFEDMVKAMHPFGTLGRLGLVPRRTVSDCEDLVSQCDGERIYTVMQGHFPDASAFLGSFLKEPVPVTIERDDCSHLSGYLEVAIRLLKATLAKKERGVHILLHGSPGTGKTEFARLLAAELGARLYEVEHEDQAGASAHQDQRFASLMLGAQFLRNTRNALLLFDEAEDAFPVAHRGAMWLGDLLGKRVGYGKAWMNRLLENMPVPILWATNSMEGMDPAFLRRFALHIRFPELPTAAKRKLTDQYLAGVGVGEPARDEIARLRGLTPGQLQVARRVTTLCKPKGPVDAERIVRLQLQASRRVQGLGYLEAGADLSIPYSPEYVNLRAPMTVPLLREGLRNQKRAAVCLYGKPGTGKTQLSHHIAQELGREMILKSASDLLSPWLGMTEKLIAELFEDARERADEVIVVLDEADSFLRDRSGAEASWEVSQTNEFLARMERFPGIFICTTNLVSTLDPAVLRRFQFRIEFQALRVEQAAKAFEATFGRAPSAREQGELIEGFVPADFANVARQIRFLGSVVQVEPLEMLREELRAREGMHERKRAIGFGTTDSVH